MCLPLARSATISFLKTSASYYDVILPKLSVLFIEMDTDAVRIWKLFYSQSSSWVSQHTHNGKGWQSLSNELKKIFPLNFQRTLRYWCDNVVSGAQEKIQRHKEQLIWCFNCIWFSSKYNIRSIAFYGAETWTLQ